ncbi:MULTISPECIES: hemin uptake protein HemP [unclassified Herbaspirillum]|jgi:hemin uptake protein HemP|uniref:hemin uptake protein HemP n=1 Tax=unclassified Herbaspirillum TaxID=2624150 RepID=UPI000B98E087|nr:MULTISPECIES: hemin uptake protein HemP [unclassified Herbaspirillum]ASU40345.1 hemin transporter [Herbaspirillum sp. meg3]RFB70649.1 hemin uptake protein HemP [Herbaspirillum sp. 3R-3a1]TFI08830.1 hemin uptake protein HemP [Herbaspirillum sp. 3R11]TFI15245.1 hemin uptake protein HemP [Herbaspirillum sp. 3R-11]TFI19913.1 hemin uptake protein HemP [Herbaspirillum sp. 3C11]
MNQLIEHGSERRNKPATAANGSPITRIKSQDLFRQMRELEIDHGGRIYKLRLTQLNKLILTA